MAERRKSWVAGALSLALLAGGALSGGLFSAAKAASPDYNTGSINVAFDGTGHGTSSQTFINSANGFSPGDNSPTDGFVATRDYIGYNVSLRFAAGPQRTVRVQLGGGFQQETNTANVLCVGGVGFTATGTDLDCTYSIRAGAVASVDALVMVFTTDAMANTKVTGTLTMDGKRQAPAGEVTVLAAPALDFVLKAGQSVVNSTTGVGTFSLAANNIASSRFNPVKGYYRPRIVPLTFTSPDLPDGTTLSIGGQNGTFQGGRVTLTDVIIPGTVDLRSPMGNGATGVLTVPAGAYPTEIAAPPAVYSLAVVVGPEAVKSGELLNNGDGVQPGNGQPSYFVTYDPTRNIQPGSQFANNDWTRVSYVSEEHESGDIFNKSNLAHLDPTSSIFEEGNMVYPNWTEPGTRALGAASGQVPQRSQMGSKTQFETRLTINSDALVAGTAPQFTLCDNWAPGQAYDPLRPIIVTDASGKTVNSSLYTVEYSDAAYRAGEGCDAPGVKWTAAVSNATTSVKVSLAAGVVKAGTGTWTVRLPMKSPDEVTPEQHLSLVPDTATFTSSTHPLTGRTDMVRHVQLVRPQSPTIAVGHSTEQKTVGADGKAVTFTIEPALGQVAYTPKEPATYRTVLSLDPCFYDFKNSSVWTATVTPGTARCGTPGGTPTTVEFTWTGVASYNADHAILLPPTITYTVVASTLASNGQLLANSATVTSTLTGALSAAAPASVPFTAPLVTSQFLEAVTPRVEIEEDLVWKHQFYATGAEGQQVTGTVIFPRATDKAVTQQLDTPSLEAYTASGEPLESKFHGTLAPKTLSLDPNSTTAGARIEITTDPRVGTGVAVIWTSYTAGSAVPANATGARVVIPAASGTSGGGRTALLNITMDPTNNLEGDLYLAHTEPVMVGTLAASPKTWPALERVVMATVSGTVWWDENNDSYLDASEPGIEGVTVELLKGGAVVASTKTDSKGFYEFSGLKHDPAYSTRVVKTAAMTETTTKYGKTVPVEQTYSWNKERFAKAKTTSDGISLPVGGNQPRVDYGFFKPNPSLLLDKNPASTVNNNNGTYDLKWDVQVVNDGNTPITSPVFSDRMDSELFNVRTTTDVSVGNVFLPKVKKMTAEGASTFLILSDGSVYAAGSNSRGALGMGDTTQRLTPTKVPLPNAAESVVISKDGLGSSFFVLSDGSVYATGDNSYGILGLGDTNARSTPTKVALPSAAKSVVATVSSTFFLLSDGSVYGTGRNSGGQLGLGDTAQRSTPTKVNLPGAVESVVAHNTSTFFILTDGSVYAAGYNSYGQLSLGDLTARSIPTKVPLPSAVASVTAHSYATFFILTDGSVYAAGVNSSGQLGLGRSLTHAYTPTKVSLPNDAKTVVACSYYTFFILSDGSVYATGESSSGQLGLGDTDTRYTPTRVPLPSAAESAISRDRSGASTLFLLSDGSIYATGDNNNGGLGLGDTTQRLTPTKVALPTTGESVTGSSATFFLLSDGSVYATGPNSSGQLGLGDRSTRYAPERLTTVALSPTVPTATVAALSEATSGSLTTRTYQPATIQPGTAVTYHFTATARQGAAEKFFQNTAWVNSDQTPLVTPQGHPAVDASNFLASSLLKDDGSREAGFDGDLVDGTPARIPATAAALGSLSGIVWEDLNRNGLRDPGEPLRANSPVTLFQSTNVVGQATTDANGFYKFENLPAASNYEVQFAATGEREGNYWAYTKKGTSKTALTSFVDISTGRITGLAVVADQENAFNNAGLVTVTTSVTVDKTINGADGSVLPLEASTGLSAASQVVVRVTNPASSTESLTNFKLSDETLEGPAAGSWVWTTSTGTIISNPATYTLAPGGYLTVTGTLPAMEAGTVHRDEATVSAFSASGVPVTDSDDSSVTVVKASPSITVKKYFDDTAADGATPTNQTADGQVSDANEVPVRTQGTDVRATYVVTNNGNQPLYSVTLTGPKTSAVAYSFPEPLLPGQTVIFTGPREAVSLTETLDSPVTVTAVTHDATGSPAQGVRASDEAKAERASQPGNVRVEVYFKQDPSQDCLKGACVAVEGVPGTGDATSYKTDGKGGFELPPTSNASSTVGVEVPAGFKLIEVYVDGSGQEVGSSKTVDIIPAATRVVVFVLELESTSTTPDSPTPPRFESGL